VASAVKTMGLLGGMSWESTLVYYRAINEIVRESLGGLHSASLILNSVDFGPLERLQHADDWAQIARVLAGAAIQLERAGADFLIICTNTMHRVAPEIQEALQIPLLHIADATGEVLVEQGIKTVGLLGTAFTMEQPFYRERLEQHHQLDVIVPDDRDRAFVHKVIYEELCLGRFRPEARQEYLRIIDRLAARGAEAVILGCTEIGMLVDQQSTTTRLLDTTAIHARKAVEYAL